MLASVCRCPAAMAAPPFLFPISRTGCSQTRSYVQQRATRTAQSQQTTTAPSSTAQVKNRSFPSSSTTKHATSPQPTTAKVDEKGFAKLRQQKMLRELEESGDQLEMVRLAAAAGIDPYANKATLLDLRIPPKINSFQTLKDSLSNNLQNILSMYRLAYDFAFPGIITKWRLSPQLFRAKSTSDKAWVAPFRLELLDVYKRINQAIASGDRKTLRSLTAYEYQAHASALLQRNVQRQKQTGLRAQWTLHHLLTPVQILSLRAFPFYSAPEEPKYGNRNCIQALVRFESLQTLVLKDPNGRIVKPDGKVVDREEEERMMRGQGKVGDWRPEPKRVLEYLVCENKMFYPDGWYVRDQMFEGVKPKFSQSLV
ncbi:hypothetical protein ACEPAI_10002 [Sanghuangporus weigelae]